MEIENDTKQKASGNVDLSQEAAPRSPFEQMLFECGIDDDPSQAQFVKRPLLQRIRRSLGLEFERPTEKMSGITKE